QQSPIIELREKLNQLYPPQYVFNERELCAWKTMLKASGCTNITPFKKDDSTSSINKDTLQLLYNNGFLCTTPFHIVDVSNKFWKCFYKSLEENKNGMDGKSEFFQ
ncbi:10207_t:CDS:2, partial [Gigaspora rosea]